VFGSLVGAGAARALSRVPGFDSVHLVANAAETGSVFDLEPVGGQGGGTGSAFLMAPVDHGRVAITESLFLCPVCEGTGNGGDLKKSRGEGRADLRLVEPDSPRFSLDQPGAWPR
jgi:hypothetical protein